VDGANEADGGLLGAACNLVKKGEEGSISTEGNTRANEAASS
jgi:hypothetical protein